MIKFKTKELQKAFKQLSPAIGANSIIPALEYIHCRCEGNIAYLRSSNMALDIVYQLPVESDIELLLLPYAHINAQLPNIPDTDIFFDLEGSILTMQAGKPTWKMPTENPLHYPVLIESGDMAEIDVEEDYIIAIKEAARHRSQNASKPFIAGICLNENDIVGVEDTYAYTRTLKYNIPGNYHLQHIFADALQIAPARIAINDRFISAKQGDKTVRCTLYEQHFADYTVFFPKQKLKYNIEIAASDLIKNLERIIAYKDNTATCILGFEPNKLTIKYENIYQQNSFYNELECLHQVETKEVELFATPFRNILQDSGEEIRLCITDQKTPVYITSEKEGLLNFIMPAVKNN